MGRKLFLGSVGTAEAFRRNPETKELEILFVSKTLTDSSVNISITKDDLRAGTGAPIVASFYHDAAVEITLTDVMFKREYIEAQLGTKFKKETGAYQSENKTAVGGVIELEKAPSKIGIGCGEEMANVWYTVKGADDWHSVAQKDINVEAKTVKVGEADDNREYCVRYYALDSRAMAAEVTSELIPEELFLIITAPIFAGDSCSASNGKKAGTIQYEIPRFRLNGGQEFAMAMSSNQPMNLAGSALAFDDGCDANSSKLLKIIEVLDGREWYDDVAYLMIDTESVAAKEPVDIYAVSDKNEVSKVSNDKFRWEITGAGNTISNDPKTEGVVTAYLAAGTLTATAAAKPELKVTVDFNAPSKQE